MMTNAFSLFFIVVLYLKNWDVNELDIKWMFICTPIRPREQNASYDCHLSIRKIHLLKQKYYRP